jgi:hypothetical protein
MQFLTTSNSSAVLSSHSPQCTTHALSLLSVLCLHLLLGNRFQRRSSLSFCLHSLKSSLAVAYLTTTRRSYATTYNSGTSLPPTILPGRLFHNTFRLGLVYLARLSTQTVCLEVKIEVMLPLMISRPVCLRVYKASTTQNHTLSLHTCGA